MLELAVDRHLVPNLGHFILHAVSARDLSADRCAHICEELLVLGLVMASVPLVLAAVAADLEDKDELFLLRH